MLLLIGSERKPCKIKDFGGGLKFYDFLLKGHEDLRQDERVMQPLSLNTTLLKKNGKTEKKILNIITYPVIPMSKNTRLLSWVQKCDVFFQMIIDYRQANHTQKDAELRLMRSFCPNYQTICGAHKVEAYSFIMDSTRGEDLKKMLWLRSEKRNNYVRSLATMSMVGHILGLDDRNLSNLMMQRVSDKIVHIDFSDPSEVTMKYKDFPDRVPFRLTRMVTKTMEACGIEGNYRSTCKNVMEVLRENKESLLAILESFVTDPLTTLRNDERKDEQKCLHPTHQKPLETCELLLRRFRPDPDPART